MRNMQVLIGALFAGVFVIGIFSGRWFDAPDYEALCTAECACTGCAVLDCVDGYERRGKEQGECREAGDAIAACKVEQGGAKCESGGGWTLYTPTEKCRAQLDAFGACLETRADTKRAEVKEVSEVRRPTVSFAQAMRVMCDASKDINADELPPSERASAWAEHIDAKAKNAEFEEFLGAITAMPAEQRDAALREALKRAGIDHCAMLTTTLHAGTPSP